MKNKKNHGSNEWISARHLQHFVACGETAGLPMEEILGQVGLSRAQLASAEGGIAVDTLEQLFSRIASRIDVPLGLYLARNVKPATLGTIGLIAQACETVADVLDVITRFNGLLSNIGWASVSHGPGVVRVHWQCRSAGSARFHRHATEYVLGAFVSLTRLLLPDGQTLINQVCFPHSKPTGVDAGLYQQIFQCPVIFQHGDACIEMPASACQVRLQHGDASLKVVLEQYASDLLLRNQQQVSFAKQVEEEVRTLLLRQSLDKAEVARRLGISARSLQRRMQEEGLSYRAMVDRVRLDLANERLSDERQPLGEIAKALCFSSHQAFIRWFKDKQGKTPGAYRRALLG